MSPSDCPHFLGRRPIRLTLAVLGLLAACVKADVLRLDTAVRPATAPHAVQLLATEPNEPYVVIALVSVSSAARGVDALRQRLVREASRLGGHAVLLDAESLTRTDDQRLLSAKVIVFERSSR